MMTRLFTELRTEVKTNYKLVEKPFDIPVLPQAQCIVIPIVREAIAPLLIRNNDTDMVTDMLVANELRVRIIASKTKGVERRRGSQILRTLGVGGWAATNKEYITGKPSEVFDLNTFVFGASANGNKKAIYPVHAAVLYSDALSLQPYEKLIDDVFRQGGIGEEFVSYDPEKRKTSSNIFTTRAVLPGTLFVQNLVMIGHRITREAFNHLLLSIGLAGCYGGATATTGTNLKTHWGGVYWGKMERSINAPSEIFEQLQKATELPGTANALVESLERLLQTEYPQHISASDLRAHVDGLVEAFETGQPELKQDYEKASVQARELFDAWFKLPEKTSKTGKKGKGKGKVEEVEEEEEE